MTLASIRCPTFYPGNSSRIYLASSLSGTTALDAAGEYFATIFAARESMTISHVGFRPNAVIGAGTADIRIETVDASGLPTGALWGTNTNIAGDTLTSATFSIHALTASASISPGDVYAIVFKYNSGTSFSPSIDTAAGTRYQFPYHVLNTGTPTKQTFSRQVLTIGSSSTDFYDLDDCFAVTGVAVSETFNNTSDAARGMRFQVPFKCRCSGLHWFAGTTNGSFTIMLQDDAGAELATTSTTYDGDHNALTGNRPIKIPFDSPATLEPATWYRALVKPTSATNVTIRYWPIPSSAYLATHPGGDKCYYTAFTTGGGWVDDQTKVPFMDIVVDQFDDGAGGGGGSAATVIGSGGLVF